MQRSGRKMMLNKIKRITRYLLYIIISNLLYGLILWYTCIWLAGYSLLYAYLGNLALIVFGLALDEYSLRMYQSEKTITQIKKEKDAEKALHLAQLHMDNFVSFKAALYLFYILILILSQIIEFDHTLISGDLETFIQVTKYSILLLVAYDMLTEQFSKDKRRMKKITALFNKHWNEDQD